MDESYDDDRPSAVGSGDPDWSQLQDIVRMLELAIAQIEMALLEGDESLDTLSSFFSSMAGRVNNISRVLTDLREGSDLETIRETVLEDCQLVKSRMNTTIIAFQFYDKLSQRLGHVSSGLADLAQLVASQKQTYSPFAWKDLQERMKVAYSLEEEQRILEAMRSGCSMREALKRCEKARRAKGIRHDIEFF
jgi:hypothetical protein